jgi:hypothetical protein
LVTHRFPLGEVRQALEASASNETSIKVVVDPRQ